MPVKTREQVKAEFKKRGETFADFARSHGWRPIDVYNVIGGVFKGNYGRSHDIAVALGLKEKDGSK